MTDVYFVRHGETDLNRQHVVQGHIDTHGLNDEGRGQAWALVKLVIDKGGLKADAVLTSPLRRARETADILCQHFGVAPKTDDRLKEMNFGRCEGMTVPAVNGMVFTPPLIFKNPAGGDVTVLDGQALRRYHASTDPMYDNVAHPGGETKAEARRRVQGAVTDYLNAHPDIQTLWVVSHGAVIRFLASDIDEKDRFSGAVQNAGVLHFTYTPGENSRLIYRGAL